MSKIRVLKKSKINQLKFQNAKSLVFITFFLVANEYDFFFRLVLRIRILNFQIRVLIKKLVIYIRMIFLIDTSFQKHLNLSCKKHMRIILRNFHLLFINNNVSRAKLLIKKQTKSRKSRSIKKEI